LTGNAGYGRTEDPRKVKQRGLDVPIIMMTGHSSMETAIKAIRMGAKDYLSKPVR